MAKKINWGLIGGLVGVCVAPFTGGASLGMAMACGGLGFAGGKVAEATGILDNGDDSDLDAKLAIWKTQTEQWQALVKANQEEAKRLREEKEANEKQIKHNNEETTRLNAVINNPHSSEEERSNARKRIILLEDENKDLKSKNRKLDSDITEKSQIPVAPSRPWIFPKLSLVDKTLITGGVVMIIYLIIPSKKT